MDKSRNQPALRILLTNAEESAEVQALGQEVKYVAGQTTQLTFADHGYTGGAPAQVTREDGAELQAINMSGSKNLRVAAVAMDRRAQFRYKPRNIT
ncbi:hypothetical protein [Burkholderia lata]|uniref:hypothetical protein n=1 Tax=Burkholderia lata (strain ATCC 17760 / DSM 23089 / LMG 22485 / NCIMB 9086 / R18194 / 383) TaxID=482957 RepID=UPI00158147D9|nr:hypothetical protein [Burkholderia lata]